MTPDDLAKFQANAMRYLEAIRAQAEKDRQSATSQVATDVDDNGNGDDLRQQLRRLVQSVAGNPPTA